MKKLKKKTVEERYKGILCSSLKKNHYKVTHEFEFKFIEINGLRLSEPNQFYSYFLKVFFNAKL